LRKDGQTGFVYNACSSGMSSKQHIIVSLYSRVQSEKLIVTLTLLCGQGKSRNCPHFMKPQVHYRVTHPYPGPEELSPHTPLLGQKSPGHTPLSWTRRTQPTHLYPGPEEPSPHTPILGQKNPAHTPLSWARRTQPTYPYPIATRSILIILYSPTYTLSFPAVSSGFVIKSLYAILLLAMRSTFPSYLILLEFVILVMYAEQHVL
jgi:hypothetical protein